jgi:hypothetical protein
VTVHQAGESVESGVFSLMVRKPGASRLEVMCGGGGGEQEHRRPENHSEEGPGPSAAEKPPTRRGDQEHQQSENYRQGGWEQYINMHAASSEVDALKQVAED